MSVTTKTASRILLTQHRKRHDTLEGQMADRMHQHWPIEMAQQDCKVQGFTEIEHEQALFYARPNHQDSGPWHVTMHAARH